MNKTIWDRLFPWACLLCALPVLLPHYPPMVDMPAQTAMVAGLKSVLTHDGWAWSRLFEIKAFTPFWLGYGVILLLSLLAGAMWATKLVVVAVICLLPWTMARFCRQMGVPAAWCWLFLVLPFGFAFQWGLLEFLLGAPLGFLFLSSLIEHRDTQGWKAWLPAVLWLHLLFFTHLMTAGFFSILAMLLLADPWQGFKRWMRRCLSVFSVLPITMVWVLMERGSVQAQGQFEWHIGLFRLIDIIQTMTASKQVLVGCALALLFLAVPFLFGNRIRRSWLAWAPFLFYLAWMIFFPENFGTFATTHRFGIFGLPLYFLGFEKKENGAVLAQERLLRGTIIAAALLILFGTCMRAMTFDSETRGLRMVMEHMQPGKRLLLLPFDYGSRTSDAPLMEHIGGWYEVEKRGLAEFNYAGFWNSPLQYRHGVDYGKNLEIVSWDPSQFDWQRDRGDLYDYILVRCNCESTQWMAEKSRGKMKLQASIGEWALYMKASQ